MSSPTIVVDNADAGIGVPAATGARTTITSVRSAAREKRHSTNIAVTNANAAAPIRIGTRTDRPGRSFVARHAGG